MIDKIKALFVLIKAFLMSLDLANVSGATIARGIAVLVVTVNYGLSAFGMSPIDVDQSALMNAIVVVITIVVFLVAYWKNNSFTRAAIEADAKLQELKAAEQASLGKGGDA